MTEQKKGSQNDIIAFYCKSAIIGQELMENVVLVQVLVPTIFLEFFFLFIALNIGAKMKMMGFVISIWIVFHNSK